MPTLPPFDQATRYNGVLDKIPFEIVRWGLVRASGEALNNGQGCWNYYVFLRETRIENFKDFWIEPKLEEFSSGGTKFIDVPRYYNSPLSDADWHGGPTYWEAINPSFEGMRAIKIGCDYSHLYDMEARGYCYDLEEVYSDLINTINQLNELLIHKK